MAVGDPTGNDLCSGTTNGNTITSGEEREITIDTPVELTSGVKYAIIVRAPDAPGGASVGWWRKTSDNYANGVGGYSVNSGSTWTQEATTDYWFATKEAGVEKDAHKANNVSAPAILGTTWRFQTFTASSTYTINSIVLKLSKGGSPGTVIVSIRATVPNAPTKATTPVPTDAVSNVTLDQATLAWTDGGGATSYDVYYGTVSGSLTRVSTGQAGTSFSLAAYLPFDYGVTRYWRIDSINAGGTTEGDEWSFTTISLDPPVPTGSNNMITIRRLVAAANDKLWYEDI